MFEPIREDLRAVERAFADHVQSQVQLIPTIGSISAAALGSYMASINGKAGFRVERINTQ